MTDLLGCDEQSQDNGIGEFGRDPGIRDPGIAITILNTKFSERASSHVDPSACIAQCCHAVSVRLPICHVRGSRQNE